MPDRTIRNTQPHDYLDLYLAYKENEGKEDVTIRNYRRAVTSFIEATRTPEDVSELTSDHVVLWLADLRKTGIKDSTLAWYQRHCYPWLTWLYKRGLVAHDPSKGVERVTVDQTYGRTVTPEVMTRLCTALADPRSGVSPERRTRNMAVIRTLWSTGLRRAELAALTYADLDLDYRLPNGKLAARIIVRKAKTDKPRQVPLDKPAKVAIREWLIFRGHADGSLFHMSSDAIRTMLQRLATQAGVKASSHDFRRGFAAHVRANGMDIAHTQRLLGHETPTMAMRYSEAGEDEAALRAYYERLG